MADDVTASNVIPFAVYTRTRTGSERASGFESRANLSIARSETQARLSVADVSDSAAVASEEAAAALTPASVEELYPPPVSDSALLERAMKILHRARSLLADAVKDMVAGDVIGADTSFMQMSVSTPALYACRDLSAGFASISNAVLWSIQNLEGVPPRLEQLHAILHAIEHLENEPFISLDVAIDQVICLEDTGLVPEPTHMAFLVDIHHDFGPR